jgi:asparagine synthase (glutamine-hydrolysing)
MLNRRKMGFGVPLATWFRKDLKDFTRDVLLDARTRQRGILRPEAVARLLDAHVAGRRDYSSQLWSLICFELWCRQWS